MSATPAESEQRFERELYRDQQLRLLTTIGGWTVALSTFVMIYVLSIAFARTSPWLMALPVYMIGTRAVAFICWKAFLYPRFLLTLNDQDQHVAIAAQAVLERHRRAIVRPILKSLMRDADEPAIAAVADAELTSLARQYDINRKRHIARRWFVVWCVLSVLLWGALIATGAGPRE